MSRVAAMFERLARARRRALVAFLTMGDPSIATSIELARVCLDAGADALELGVPFSDPTADGPVIARASERAIRAGSTLRRVLDAAAELRATTNAPLVLFTYANPLVALGEARAIELVRAAGVDALLVVDLPPEEGAELRAAAREGGVAIVPLVAPTSTRARVDTIVRHAVPPGSPPTFLYAVSMTGVTGADRAPLDVARHRARELRAETGLPVVVGFGIDGPEAARAAAGRFGEGPDGIVVGSAIVKRVEDGGDARARVGDFVRSLRAALDAET